MYAYFGEMPNIAESWTLISRFEDRYEKATGRRYQKNEERIYQGLVEYGDFETAYALAERNLKRAKEEHKQPSESYPACTVHHLVKEIIDKTSV